ncbi:GNAT family N-acetyltransferase [Kribbella sp. CA-293567]|uniref:GNAT family N-acetyltransferase n=1 Tax=Kribbella sp. CA-293567 TaxID=3002436 RepID=UPI0022DE01B9|nr:GNAT family protein [Kribbella sp. CA-293567]WBQ01982.1 GNAT family protein [Kribbella sp. CA-293567]
MTLDRPLTDEISLRVATLNDAAAFAEAQVRDREHLRPWEPVRSERWFTTAGQQDRLEAQLARFERREVVPWFLFLGDRVVGAITLSDLVPGPFRSASLGYWIASDQLGKGLATTAVQAVAELADRELLLHRIEASTLTDNLASQRVLTKAGFRQIGTAPTYLHIAGVWQDCHLFQRILNNRNPGAPA